MGTWYVIAAFLPFSNVLLTLAIFLPDPLISIVMGPTDIELLDISLNGETINWSIVNVYVLSNSKLFLEVLKWAK